MKPSKTFNLRFMKPSIIKGVGLLSFSLLGTVLMSALSKMLTSGQIFTPIEVVFWQTTVALPLVSIVIYITGGVNRFKTKRFKAQMGRAIPGNCGFLMMYSAYALMPMADVATLLFTGGLMTTFLSALWLKERVGFYRWLAVIIGFIGAAIAAAPSGDDWQFRGIIYALIAAFIGGGVVNIMLRKLGTTEHAMTTTFYTLVCGLLMTAPYTILYGRLPEASIMAILAICGFASAVILIAKTQAFRYAEASLLSPVQYTMIIWAALAGWFIWQDIPTTNVIVGASIIIIANIVILIRENQKAKIKTTALPKTYSDPMA